MKIYHIITVLFINKQKKEVGKYQLKNHHYISTSALCLELQQWVFLLFAIFVDATIC